MRHPLLTGLALSVLASLSSAPVHAATAPGAPPFATLARQFEEPLIAGTPGSAAESADLTQAILAYREPRGAPDFAALEAFLAAHPDSPWRLALLTNLGLAYYHQGYFDRAIAAYEQAWAVGRGLSDPRMRALTDRAAGELLQMHARLGHADRLAALLAEMQDRGLTGRASELRDGAKEGLWMMRNNPGVAYLCGPMALKNLLLAGGKPASAVGFLDAYRAGTHGVTLAEVASLAQKAGVAFALVHRDADAPVPVPAIIHWKVNHFAAITGQRDGRYELQDPTFGRTLWVTKAAIDAEGSGYFLVPGQQSDPRWHPVSRAEATRVYGMGYTNDSDPSDDTPDDCGCGGGGDSADDGMAGYTFREMLVSLNVLDTPVGYVPPKGPSMKVTVSYNQREAGQPATFSFFNVSPKWTLNWLSYVEDDPTMVGNNVTRIVRGGGYVDETGYSTTTQAFAPEIDDGSVLTLTSSNPVTYTRTLRAGGSETYTVSNGATAYPRLVFLSQIVDRYGNAVNLTYDSEFRLTKVTDATKRATTFSYGNSKFPLQVTKIADPFGRSATLAYDSSGRLSSITDVLGIKSVFAYDSSSLVDALTTPYGTTSFTYGDNGNSRYLTATDPLGHTEQLQYVQGAPGVPSSDSVVPQGIVAPFNAYLNDRDTFYWDKHAYAVAPTNFLAARNRHWAHLASNTNVTSNTLESEQYPLENRVWFNYPGQPTGGLGAGQSGTLNLPTAIARVLDDGSTQLTQIAYNAIGNPTSFTDPVGRTTLLNYAANSIDVTSVQQATGTTPATVAKYTYDTLHLPLTFTNAAGGKTTYTYNAAGQLTKLVDPLGHATTNAYNALGYLTSVTNAAGKTQVSYTYDKYGHIATQTDSEGLTVGFAYDNFDRVTKATFPDGTSITYAYNLLDLVSVTDRQGRKWSATYDAAERLTGRTDPDGKTTSFTYYEDGTPATITDANGNTTSFAIDLQSRVTGKQYADGSVLGFGYSATNSRLLFVADPLNQIKQYTYLPDGSLSAVQYFNTVNPTPGVAFTWDPYYPRLTGMTDGSGTTQYTYGATGKAGALQLSGEAPPFANSAIAYTYDLLGRRTGRSVGGNAETLTYDTLGRVATHTDDLGTFTFAYLGQTGQVTSQGNGTVATAWTYASNTNDRRLASVATTPNATTYSFTTTPDYDITAIIDSYNSQTWSYTYDSDDRLQGASSTLGTSYAYGYDPVGNLGSIQRPSGTTTITSNALNQIASSGSTAFTYDADGNLLRDYARTYSWDAENRLIGIGYIGNPGTTTSFQYDGIGRRIAIGTTSGGVSSQTHYGWCGQTLCQARTGADAVLKHYYQEGEETPSENMALYYGIDQLGTVHDALAAGTGASVAHYDYEPYGLPTGTPTASATDFRYAGLFYHQQSGLYLATNREYDPTVGRWISRDPVSEAGGLNLYAYANGDPIVGSDPLGLWTGQIGLGGSVNIPLPWFPAVGLNLNLGFGIAFDGNGNVGLYGYGGAGAYAGTPGASGGVQLYGSNAQTICDLGGPFLNGSVGGKAGIGGSVDGFTGSSPNGQVYGGGVTVGAGFGQIGGSVGGSYTGVAPLFHF